MSKKRELSAGATITPAELAQYIATLFPKERVPRPVDARTSWTSREVGYIRHITESLRRLVPGSVAALDEAQLRQEAATLEAVLKRWEQGSWKQGKEPLLSGTHIASIYHLLRNQSAAHSTPSSSAAATAVLPTIPAPVRRFGKWTVVRSLDKGGQGEVFEVETAGELHRALKKFVFRKGDRGAQARERFRRELEALRSLDHPGILRVHDADAAAGWMVSTLYHSTLEAIRPRFRGRALEALQALRPVIEALAAVHQKGGVHRDVKPKNIFVDSDGSLVLGDFGIVFFRDAEGARLTTTYERVGSRDWMPSWADVPNRIDEVLATADVFGLGKVLWSMVSGDSVLPLWYFDRPKYDLEDRFPGDPGARWLNEILAKTVVENETACLPSAVQLLPIVDQAITSLRRGGTVLREGQPWPCRECGLGYYELQLSGEARALALPKRDTTGHMHTVDALYGWQNASLTVKTYACSACGHIKMFWYPDERRPVAWRPARKKL